MFEDLDYSGKNTTRPAYQSMLARIERGDVAVVAAYSLSRISRSVVDLYNLLKRLEQLGVAFVSATEPIDTSTAMGRAFLGFLAVLAQLERELTSERVSDNLASKAPAGELVGPVPAGYIRKDGTVGLDPERAETVRLISASTQQASGHSSRWLAS